MSDKVYNINISKESIIEAQQEKIKSLKEENQNLLRSKLQLEARIRYFRTLEEKLNKSQIKVRELKKKHEEYVIQKEKELKDLQLKYDKLEVDKEYESKKYNTNISIYNQKMSLVHQTEMENEIYRNEIKELKEKNDELENATKVKLDSLEIHNAIKYNELKQKMMDHLTEAKNNVSRLNLNYMDINSKISILQNHQLLSKIEYLQEINDKLKEENKKLMKKVFEYKNDIKIHKKIETNLVSKIREFEESPKNVKNSKKQKKQKYTSLNKFNTTSFSNQNKSSSLFLNHNSSSDFKKKIFSNKFEYYENLNKFFQKDNYGNVNSKSLTSYDNKQSMKEKENSYSLYGSRNQPSTTNTGINFSRYEKILKEKNNEIENLKLKNEKLKDKLNVYYIKYKGLFNFLEECLNEFFNDEQLLNIKNVNINIEDIKKFDFSIFKKEEKYSILLILMNYLMPMISFNFRSNCNIGNAIFKTNINIIDKKFNTTQNYLNDIFLKKAFLGKNNKTLNTFNGEKRVNNFSLCVPILKKSNSPDYYKLLDNRFKTLV
jgi:hypothetical protein